MTNPDAQTRQHERRKKRVLGAVAVAAVAAVLMDKELIRWMLHLLM